MARKSPSQEKSPDSKTVRDERLDRVYPEGNRHDDSDDGRPKRSQKQPGQALREPKKDDDDRE